MTLNPPPLDHIDRYILHSLAEDSGYATSTVVERIGKQPSRKRTAIIFSRIRYLERHSLVGRLDDKKPIAWTRTAKGTATLTDPATTDQGGEGR